MTPRRESLLKLGKRTVNEGWLRSANANAHCRSKSGRDPFFARDAGMVPTVFDTMVRERF